MSSILYGHPIPQQSVNTSMDSWIIFSLVGQFDIIINVDSQDDLDLATGISVQVVWLYSCHSLIIFGADLVPYSRCHQDSFSGNKPRY